MNKKNTNPQYFEGILQLRNPTQEAFEFIKKQIEKAKDVHIAKRVRIKSGMDFYLNSNQFLMQLGRRLQKAFGGRINVSATLHTRHKQSSKNLYRVTFLIVLPKFKKGDIISAESREKSEIVIYITSLDKKIHGINLKTGKKIGINYSDDIRILETYKTIVTKIRPHLEAMHPETYQSVRVDNKQNNLRQGKKVTVVLTEDGVFIV